MCLFNDALSSSECTALNGKIRKDANALSRHPTGGTEEIHEETSVRRAGDPAGSRTFHFAERLSKLARCTELSVSCAEKFQNYKRLVWIPFIAFCSAPPPPRGAFR
jgi:hypothetical protein